MEQYLVKGISCQYHDYSYSMSYKKVTKYTVTVFTIPHDVIAKRPYRCVFFNNVAFVHISYANVRVVMFRNPFTDSIHVKMVFYIVLI